MFGHSYWFNLNIMKINKVEKRKKENDKKKIFIVSIFISLLNISSTFFEPYWPKLLWKKSFHRGVNLGKGNNSLTRPSYESRNEFERQLKYPNIFQSLVHLEILEFKEICLQTEPLTTMIHSLDWFNKVFLVFRYMISALPHAELASIFGISLTTTSRIISEVLKVLYTYFQSFIPNFFEKNDNTETSILNERLCLIIDGTTHPIRRRQWNQQKFWRADKKYHFVQTIYLIGYDQTIIAFETNVMGHLSDNSIPKQSKLFNRITKECEIFAISDTGFSNCRYVCQGYKKNQLNSENKKHWDKITREEQKRIEWVNCWIKKFATLSKSSTIDEKNLISIVMIASGLYNFKKLKNYYMPIPE